MPSHLYQLPIRSRQLQHQKSHQIKQLQKQSIISIHYKFILLSSAFLLLLLLLLLLLILTKISISNYSSSSPSLNFPVPINHQQSNNHDTLLIDDNSQIFKNKDFITSFDDIHDPLFDIKFKNGLLSFSEPSPLLKKRAQPPPSPPKKSSKVKPPGISIDKQEATSEELEHELHKHYEEESEDWWEVYRSYEYETADSLGNMFLVEVEEAQVIHKQHALMDDLQRAEVSTKEYASQETLNTGGMVSKSSKDNDDNKADGSGGGIQQAQGNVNNTSMAVAGEQQYQQQDLIDVKQYQRIHVAQSSAAGLLANEYEEERFFQYEYTLEIDLFNQWEYQSEQETSKNDNLELIN